MDRDQSSKRPASRTTLTSTEPEAKKSKRAASQMRPVDVDDKGLEKVTFQLGPETVAVQKTELRDNSEYFAQFAEETFPTRFRLAPSDDINDAARWRFVPVEETSPKDINASDEQASHDAPAEAYDAHRIILSIIRTGSPDRINELRARCPTVVIIAKLLEAYGCAQRVMKYLMGAVFTANFSDRFLRDQPGVMAQLAYHTGHSITFCRAIPYAASNIEQLQDQMQRMPRELSILIKDYATAFSSGKDSIPKDLEAWLHEKVHRAT
ncbi:hypothetical protein SLS56_012196 [Neofusicoccum ribis]|uniref:BTB domain-containing protein n=1 Tax=Neofusicoccum ribis TaxID=45134 RepID=A0ABR3S9I8_9PEZI